MLRTFDAKVKSASVLEQIALIEKISQTPLSKRPCIDEDAQSTGRSTRNSRRNGSADSRGKNAKTQIIAPS
jgi:hypothetical protein